jgi:hypothetical protein
MFGRGADAEMRSALGVAVFSGMLGVTLLGIFFTSVFYSAVMWFTQRRPPHSALNAAPANPAPQSRRRHGEKTPRTRVAQKGGSILVKQIELGNMRRIYRPLTTLPPHSPQLP